MGPDREKQFMKKNAAKIPAGEQVRGVIIAEAKGGAWRRGMAATSTAAEIAHDTVEKQRQTAGSGVSAAWPAASIFWLAITDKQLHVFEGRVNSQDAGPGEAHFPLSEIAGMDYDKKLLISKLTVTFRDGSAITLDVAKQKVQPFVDAISSRA